MDIVVMLSPSHPDGVLTDAHQPQLSALAQGLSRGDGIFETLLFDGSRVKKVSEHLWRLQHSARITGISLPAEEAWHRAIRTAVAAWRPEDLPGVQPGQALVKLIVVRGYAPENPAGYAWVSVTPMPAALRPTGPIRVALLERAFDSGAAKRAPWLLLGAKTLSYASNMAALREAARRGADDVLFTTTDGLVLEGPTSTVVALAGGRLLTPPTEIGVLPGTTQRVLFRAAEQAGWATGVARLTPQDLREADAVWLTSSGRLMSQVRFLDDAELRMDDEAHRQLMALLLATE